MIEVKNKYYIQRFFATNLPRTDLFRAVTYTCYIGDKDRIPFWYKKGFGHTGSQRINLDDESILNCFKSNTRNEVRRAIKEGCEFEHDVDFNYFVEFYNRFAGEKNLPTINRSFLDKYDRIITTCATKNGQILAMHATLFSQKDNMAMLMLSCSPRLEEGIDRRLIGWGNRFLHYRDFLFFRNMGANIYEWNGINMNPETPDRYSIGQFKLGFGCEPVESVGLQTPLFVLMHYVKFHLLNRFRR